MDSLTPKHEGRRTRLNPRFIWFVVAAALFVLVGRAAWVKANEKNVEIAVDGRVVSLTTLKKTVEEALAEARVSLGPADETIPSPGQKLAKRQKVTITRAVPVVVIADGKKSEVSTTRKTVREVLASIGVTPGELDRVKPAKDSPVIPDMVIEVTRIKEETTVSRQVIPFTTQKREDDTLEIGITKVVQPGENGVREVRYRTIYENGKKGNSVQIDSRVSRQAVPRIMAYGTAGTINRGNQTIRFKKAFEMTATAYYPGPESTGRWANGYTSIGMKATYGIVAVDPTVIPLRSRLYIDGYGYAIAGDVGSAIKGLRVDLCFDSKDEALRFGRKKIKVYLLE